MYVQSLSFGSVLLWYKHNTMYLKVLSAVASNSYKMAARVSRFTNMFVTLSVFALTELPAPVAQ